METKKASIDWEQLVPKEFKLVILDPDGWDRQNFEYSFCQEEITKQEFINRLKQSTIQGDMRNIFKFLEGLK